MLAEPEHPVASKLVGFVESRGPQLVTGGVVGAYLLTSWFGPRWLRTRPSIDVYVFRPVLWAVVAGLAIAVWRRQENRRPIDRFVFLVGMGAGVVHVAILGIGGIVAGFGRSTSSVSIVNIPLYVWFLAAGLAGAETARPVLLRYWGRRRPDLAFVGVTVLFFVVATPSAQFFLVDDLQPALRVVGGVWVPAFVVSAVSTWMCVSSGLGPSFAYRMVLAAYTALVPIVPSFNWQGRLVFGVAGAAGAALFVVAVTRAGAPARLGGPLRWGLHPAVAVTGIVLAAALAAGVLGVRTMTVTGVSMEPTYNRGDVVLVFQGFDRAELKPGDVVVYDVGRLPVVHRIVAISGDGQTLLTQGDNLPVADSPVRVDAVKGKVVGSMPLIGYPALWVTGR